MLAVIATATAGDGLARRIQSICDKVDATISVAVIIDSRDTTVVGGTARCPMMSVVKLHQAIALCRHLDRQGKSLDDTLSVPPSAMVQGTYSPMRDSHPGGIASITVGELMLYSLQQSDNIACDILFDLIGGPQAVDGEMRALDLDGFAIARTEADMGLMRIIENAGAKLVGCAIAIEKGFQEAGDQLRKEGVRIDSLAIIDAMTGCLTGQDRIARPLLGTSATVGHKTGSSDRDASGRATATNDAAFVILPDGRHYVIAIFIMDSAEDDATNARLMADISAAVYDHVTNGHDTRR